MLMDPSQEVVLGCVMDYVFTCVACGDERPPKAPLLALHAGPGKGKSTLARELNQRITCALGTGLVRFMAPSGVAAQNLFRGSTCHHGVGLTVYDKELKEQFTSDSRDKLYRLRQDFEHCKVLVIDEMSMLTCKMLREIDQRMRVVLEVANEPFGGLCVLLMGDFVQIPPIGGGDLYLRPKKVDTAAGLQSLEGYNLFKTFTLVDLISQHRATDPDHMEAVDGFRDWTPHGLRVREKFLKSCKYLKAADYVKDPTWAKSLFVCTDRKTVHQINDAMVRRFATSSGEPVVRWRLPLESNVTARLEDRVIDAVYDRVKDMWGYFVPSCPMTLTENLRPERGLSNGTQGVLDSIVLSPNETRETYDKIKGGKPGEIIELEHPPLSVLVRVTERDVDIPCLERTSEGECIIPLLPASRTVNIGRYLNLPQSKQEVTVQAHPYHILFATTYHGVQCRTLDKIILCVDWPSQPKLTYNAFYVGISRVRRTEDLRLLNLSGQWTEAELLDRLRSLVPRATLVQYMLGHATTAETFTYLNSMYKAHGILYSKESADKTVHPATFRAPQPLHPCRKRCGSKFTTPLARTTHEAQCQHTSAPSENYPCREGCGKAWANQAHRNLHEPHCKKQRRQ